MKFNQLLSIISPNQEIEIITSREYLYDRFRGKASDFTEEYSDRYVDDIETYGNRLIIILKE